MQIRNMWISHFRTRFLQYAYNEFYSSSLLKKKISLIFHSRHKTNLNRQLFYFSCPKRIKFWKEIERMYCYIGIESNVFTFCCVFNYREINVSCWIDSNMSGYYKIVICWTHSNSYTCSYYIGMKKIPKMTGSHGDLFEKCRQF